MRNSLLIPFFTLIIGLAMGGAGVFFLLPQEKQKGELPQKTTIKSDIVCNGRVDSRKPMIYLFPKVPGIVTKVDADESLTVTKSNVLMELDAQPYQRKLDLAKVNAKQAAVALEEAETEKNNFAYEINKASLAVSSAKAEADMAEKQLKQHKDRKPEANAPAPPAVPGLELPSNDAITDQLEFAAKLASIKLEYTNQTLEQLRKKNWASAIEQARAARDAANIQVAEAEDAVNSCKMFPPEQGQVLRVTVSPGASVAPGMPVPPMIFAPSGTKVIRAEVDQEFISRVEVGFPATVTDELQLNSPVYEGTVLSVSPWIARPRSVLFDPLEINDVRTAEVVIELKASQNVNKLMYGQRVRVRIKPIENP